MGKRFFSFLFLSCLSLAGWAQTDWRHQPLRITAREDSTNLFLISHVDLSKAKHYELTYDIFNREDSLLCRYTLYTPFLTRYNGSHQERKGYIIGEIDTINPSISEWLTLDSGYLHQNYLDSGSYVLVYGTNPKGIGSGTFNKERHLTMQVRQGTVDVSGNIMSLIVGKDSAKLDTANVLPRDVCFARLFNHNYSEGGSDAILSDITSGPVDASNLILPSLQLRHACYDRMFNSCNLLEHFPNLPATEMAEYCYLQMFGGCYAATEPAEIHATTMAPGCFRHTFQDCIGLTKAPDIPAKELASDCFFGIYDGCTALSEIRVHFTDWVGTGMWVNNVSPTGTFYCLQELEQTFGVNNIPEGWDVEYFVEPTAIADVEIKHNTLSIGAKVMVNGRIYIIRNGIFYDLTGQPVRK